MLRKRPNDQPDLAKHSHRLRAPSIHGGAAGAVPASQRAPKAKPTAERRCILSNEHAARHALIRLALAPDDQRIWPDVHARAPGRGAWLGANRAELEAAIANGKFKAALARSFKSGNVQAIEDLPQRIEDDLRKALADRLGLEARSGTLISGADRIERAAREGRVALLLHAQDAKSDGNRKLDQAWRVGQMAEASELRGVILPMDRQSLSAALGRENAVHVALADEKAAIRVKDFLDRLLHYCGQADRRTGQALLKIG